MFIVYVTFTILSCSLLVAVSGRPCRLSVVVRVAVGSGRGVGVTRAAAAKGLKVDFVFTFAFRFYFVCVYFVAVFCKGRRAAQRFVRYAFLTFAAVAVTVSGGLCFRTHGFKFSLCMFANPTDLYQFVSKPYRFFCFETFSPLFLTLCKFITYKFFGQSFLKKF